jgi:hypothetical protein
MISAKDLSHCIDNLAEINACLGSGNAALKRLVLEVGYILKQELDTVSAWDAQFKGDRFKGHNIDVKKLMEDNTQLFNENKQLHELNLKLKEVIDQRIPKVENAVNTINEKFDTFSTVLSNT